MLRKIGFGLVAVLFLGVAPSAFAYQSFCSECQWWSGPGGPSGGGKFVCYIVNRDAWRECFAGGSVCSEWDTCYYP